jgi:hypothetical protein
LRGDLLFSLQAWLGDNARKGAVNKANATQGQGVKQARRDQAQ